MTLLVVGANMYEIRTRTPPVEGAIIVSQYFTMPYMLKLNYLSVTFSRLPRFVSLVSDPFEER